MVGIDGFKRWFVKRGKPPSNRYSGERGQTMSRGGNEHGVLRESGLISQNQEIPSMPRIKPAFREHGIAPGQEMGTPDRSKKGTAKSVWVARGKRPGPLSQNKSET